MGTKIRLFFLFLLRFFVFSVSFSVVLVLVLKWLPIGWTPLMFFREMGDKIPEKTPVRHEWITVNEIPPALELAVVCTEDQRFLTHYGFDFEQIKEAMDEAESGGRNRGASTITQQTAKNVFLWPTSSWIRKGFETWFTILIETLWGKERILEVYLNSIEFGAGIYGCEAASQFFFNKPASKMSNAECARLAVVLPNPLKYNAGKPGKYVTRRQAWALQQMRNYGGNLEFTRVNEEEKPAKPSRNKKPNTK
ncbi:MAG TPA: monofunctional biosynthetic peptidoglycan transglycosylase [Bacteroidia bacterium]|nr:monofunctional biosynthetic peptidoglycan transglycosylase [Bacteroidia bacterium]